MNIELILDDIEGVCKEYMKDGKELMPLLFLLKENNILTVDLSSVAKEIAPYAIAEVTERTQADAVIVATENWMVIKKVNRGETIDLSKTRVTPSQDPDRIECIVISAKTPSNTYSRIYKIDRTGRSTKLSRIEETMQISNRFLDGVFTDTHKMH